MLLLRQVRQHLPFAGSRSPRVRWDGLRIQLPGLMMSSFEHLRSIRKGNKHIISHDLV